jgi:hypothetical protein
LISSKPNIEVKGSANMLASILIFGVDICDIGVSLPNIVQFLENDNQSVVISGCTEEQFISNLQKAIEKNSFLQYLSNFFVTDYKEGLSNAIDTILEEFIGDFIVPLGIFFLLFFLLFFDEIKKNFFS